VCAANIYSISVRNFVMYGPIAGIPFAVCGAGEATSTGIALRRRKKTHCKCPLTERENPTPRIIMVADMKNRNPSAEG
jgi:hypothetical protein